MAELAPWAVLTSGGLDSAILVADVARQGRPVVPLYIRCGLYWEEIELWYLHRYLAALGPRFPSLQPLVLLDQPARDLYGSHWSLTGENVPGADTPDAAVYLPGRNLLLVLKALLWCHLHGVSTVALGVLGSNPFPDAGDAFFNDLANVIGRGVADPSLAITRPFGQLHKDAVMLRGADLPLEWSFSCIFPVGDRHCGRCNKCAERRKAFAEVGRFDPTSYAA